MKSPILLNNSNLLKLSADLLERETSIRFRAKGFSMRPFIQDGDLIAVSPLRNSPVRVGDVVLYKAADDQAIVHRVIRKTIKGSGMVFFIKGDATFGQPEEVDTERILGRVVAIERNRREKKLDTKLYRIISLLFAWLSPFSQWTYPVGSKIKNIVREKRQSTWTNEDYLLVYCCRTKNGNLSEIRDIYWNVFLEKARNEGISPLVFSRLPKLAKHYDIPKYVAEELKKDYYLSATKNALIFEELKKVLGLFNQRGIQIIVMKGAALAETVYGNLALRPMSDVDLLVKNEDLYQIDGLLKKLGYSPADRAVDDVDFTSTYLTTLDYRSSAKNSLSFHVHWHFVNSTIPNESYINHIKMDDIWQDAVKTNIADTETWVMSPHHLIIHLSEHALRVTHSLNKLSYFCDIDRAINYYGKSLDWDLLVRDTIKFNLNKMVYTTLYFSRYFVDANVPEEVLLKLKPERFSIPEKIFMRKAAENKRTPGLSYLVHLSMNKGLAKKLKFVGRTLFPPKDILAQRSYISEADMNYRYYLNRIREVLSRALRLCGGN